MSNLKELGVALKAYRVAAEESVSDLAEAIELSEDVIKRTETGLQKPSLEMIELIGRHYSLREPEISRLVELAGHSAEDFSFDLAPADIDLRKLSEDYDVLFAPVLYTDMVNVVSNHHGVTINFVQKGNGEDKPVVISRVGMSHEHAKSILKVLAESIKRAEQHREETDSK